MTETSRQHAERQCPLAAQFWTNLDQVCIKQSSLTQPKSKSCLLQLAVYLRPGKDILNSVIHIASEDLHSTTSASSSSSTHRHESSGQEMTSRHRTNSEALFRSFKVFMSPMFHVLTFQSEIRKRLFYLHAGCDALLLLIQLIAAAPGLTLHCRFRSYFLRQLACLDTNSLASAQEKVSSVFRFSSFFLFISACLVVTRHLLTFA